MQKFTKYFILIFFSPILVISLFFEWGLSKEYIGKSFISVLKQSIREVL